MTLVEQNALFLNLLFLLPDWNASNTPLQQALFPAIVLLLVDEIKAKP